MSASHKLFLAAVLIAVGLGTAFFLGRPAASEVKNQPAATAQTPSVAAAKPADTVTWSTGRVQLLPETPVQPQPASSQPAGAFNTPLVSLPAMPASTMPTGSDANQNAPLPAVSSGTVASAFRNGSQPVARLRNEAPRPVGNEPRSPATIRRAPNALPDIANPMPAGDPYTVMSSWAAAPQMMPSGFAGSANSTSTIATAYSASMPPNDQSNARPAAAQYWDAQLEADNTASHVVVDGDSLERIATRYLNDPQRGMEIYNLNRDVLASPDVLPIGVELKIPDDSRRDSWDRQSRMPGIEDRSPLRAAASNNLVPVRPITSYDTVSPRAQLTAPIPAN